MASFSLRQTTVPSVHEFHGVNTVGPADTPEVLMQRIFLCLKQSSLSGKKIIAHLLFTSNGTQSEAQLKRVVAAIEAADLGVCTLVDKPCKNPNTGNMIGMVIWTPKVAALEKAAGL